MLDGSVERLILYVYLIMHNLLHIDAKSYELTLRNVSIDATSVYYLKGRLMDPELAIDRHTYTNHGECECCASTTETVNPSYQLYLDDSFPLRLSRIVIYGRTDDPKGDNLMGLIVWLGSKDTEPVAVVSDNKTLVTIHLSDVPFIATVILELAGRVDKFVLCEILVFSSNVVSQGNIVTMSSTLEYPTDYHWDGHKAVRGELTTNLSAACECCASTQFQTNPWLQLDLRKQYDFTYIDIICLKNGGDQLKGVQLFLQKYSYLMSKPAFTLDGESCVYNLLIDPIVSSQYVTLKRIGQDRILTICEITVYAKVCSSNHWGADCSRRCGHCLNGSPCQDKDGHCSSCEMGYTGATCTEEILSYNKPVKTISTITQSRLIVDGSYTTCVDYSYLFNPWIQINLEQNYTVHEIRLIGNFNTTKVSLSFSQFSAGEFVKTTNYISSENGTRTEVSFMMLPAVPFVNTVTLHFTVNSESLLVCEVIVTGDDLCPAGFYGPQCCIECVEVNCPQGKCNKHTGLCDCPPGYMGSGCLTECPEGRYGENCVHHCGRCLNQETCDRINGSCSACSPGYIEHRCDYGEDCLININTQGCRCLDTNYCNRDSGTCLYGTCAPGYVGPHCSVECPDQFYGSDCSQSCQTLELILWSAGAGAGAAIVTVPIFYFLLVGCCQLLRCCKKNKKRKRRKRKKEVAASTSSSQTSTSFSQTATSSDLTYSWSSTTSSDIQPAKRTKRRKYEVSLPAI